jgi:hypothetical protein
MDMSKWQPINVDKGMDHVARQMAINLCVTQGGKLSLCKIGAWGVATFGPAGWTLIGMGVMGYTAYKLFTCGDNFPPPSSHE